MMPEIELVGDVTIQFGLNYSALTYVVALDTRQGCDEAL